VKRFRVLTPSSDGRSVTTYVHMTVLTVEHETGARRRFERCDESQMMKVRELRERVARNDYSVDAEKVAEAMLRRLVLEAAPRRG
jgi:anti-sigma28 factor (negative regulator of flagellin synthesis)